MSIHSIVNLPELEKYEKKIYAGRNVFEVSWDVFILELVPIMLRKEWLKLNSPQEQQEPIMKKTPDVCFTFERQILPPYVRFGWAQCDYFCKSSLHTGYYLWNGKTICFTCVSILKKHLENRDDSLEIRLARIWCVEVFKTFQNVDGVLFQPSFRTN